MVRSPTPRASRLSPAASSVAAVRVIALANPLRGPASDAAYVASVMRTISGPIVLVGHSYGGAVISLAANQVTTVRALVYLDALALEAGESNVDILERFPSKLFPALQPRPFPQADGSEGIDLYIAATPCRLRRRRIAPMVIPEADHRALRNPAHAARPLQSSIRVAASSRARARLVASMSHGCPSARGSMRRCTRLS